MYLVKLKVPVISAQLFSVIQQVPPWLAHPEVCYERKAMGSSKVWPGKQSVSGPEQAPAASQRLGDLQWLHQEQPFQAVSLSNPKLKEKWRHELLCSVKSDGYECLA